MAKKKEGGDSIDDVLGQMSETLNKQFGKGTAARLSDASTLSRIDDWVSTRSMVVDAVLRGRRPLGTSLIPFGRQVEISGPENSGKTTLCAQIAAETQARGGLVIVTDTEERIAEDYWQALGVDTDRVMHLESTSIRDCFNKQYRALETARQFAGGRPVLLLWDSLGGTKSTDIVVDGKSDPMEQAEKFAMRRAAIISQGLELINQVVGKTRACYLFTNHEYSKVGVSFGDTRETRGGSKPKYFATVRLRLTPVGQVQFEDPVTSKKESIGQRIEVRALKNSMAGVLLRQEATLMAGRGFVDEPTVFDIGAKMGLIEKAGSWSTWITPEGEELKFQGFKGFEEMVVPHESYPALYKAVAERL